MTSERLWNSHVKISLSPCSAQPTLFLSPSQFPKIEWVDNFLVIEVNSLKYDQHYQDTKCPAWDFSCSVFGSWVGWVIGEIGRQATTHLRFFAPITLVRCLCCGYCLLWLLCAFYFCISIYIIFKKHISYYRPHISNCDASVRLFLFQCLDHQTAGVHVCAIFFIFISSSAFISICSEKSCRWWLLRLVFIAGIFICLSQSSLKRVEDTGREFGAFFQIRIKKFLHSLMSSSKLVFFFV